MSVNKEAPQPLFVELVNLPIICNIKIDNNSDTIGKTSIDRFSKGFATGGPFWHTGHEHGRDHMFTKYKQKEK